MTTDALIQDFRDDEQVFRVGCKPLNSKSVAAAHGNRDRVVPIAAAHLTREIEQDFCRSGGSINPSRSALNYSMLDDVPMEAAAIKARAIALMEQYGIVWRSLRRDKIMAAEVIISPPPGFADDLDAFLADSLHFAEHIAFGHQVPIIAAVVHDDEPVIHLHVLALPLTLDGRMKGHELVGYTGMHQKRSDLFYEHVGKRYGLERPTRKAMLCHADRVYLTERVLAKLAAGGPAWASNPAAMKEMRRLILADPLGMARAHGIVLPQDDHTGHQDAETAYMRLPHDGAELPAMRTNRMPVSAVAAGTLPNADADDGADGHQDAAPQITPPADPAPQPVMPGPLRIDVSSIDPGQDGEDADPPEHLVHLRDDDLPADRWDATTGEHVLPPPPPPSRREQVLFGVRMTLGARASAGRPRVPQSMPQPPAIEAGPRRLGADADGVLT